jgi:hypothetical protein
MPYGINYKRIAFVGSQAREGCSFVIFFVWFACPELVEGCVSLVPA